MENQKKEEAIETLISIDRVRGLIETIALRKKFLKHLQAKRQKDGKKVRAHVILCDLIFFVILVPTILVDNEHGNDIKPTDLSPAR